jgi:protein-tyrosine phosphatase
MAMALFSDMVKKNHEDPAKWRIESAGVWAISGLPATSNAVAAMRSLGIGLEDHRSQAVTEYLLNKFNLILCMEQEHKSTLQRNYPSYAERIYLLSEMADGQQEVDDPVGGSVQIYQTTIQKISRYLELGYSKIVQLSE